ncbi:SMP-30/gluconolactonase/LRE family protein [Desulfosporosinus sp. BICA1-9]|uniref:SMP-30/gluconolactonase/LRE family protein n=1 Tax=Desulfosporosinus sp. BICA1-9 TaxID=1531958 RepID=UPI00054C14E8|nr:SMP-30/gluconolactonase/LRE family protein [Desulfosporosinus sp. BICA1-9]KJS50578.1 MAG: SMP-30/gluconolaconase/LRE domain protein [Peptococcaceae bacterium BRH_c23]KJS82845.1 MAG: SMP-30/gluconolaconase/LRE domain protein [Desulfosporosinus sp. BICA1-9]
MNKLELVIDQKAMLGEGPIWDCENKVLYWLDILACELHVFNPDKHSDRVIETGQLIGTVVPRAKGGVVLAMEKGLYFLDTVTGETAFIADPESDRTENRFNDGKCDPAGRLFVGTMHKEGKGSGGALYCLDTDLSLGKVLDSISISNGIAWSHDHKTMYYINTPVKKVWGFDYAIRTGEISNKRVVIDGKAEEGFFDGMTIDEEGMLWIAHFGGFKVTRWEPQTGGKLDEVMLPVPNPTACAFGGEGLEDLYITTARLGLSDEELRQYPESGGLYVIRPGVKGVKSYKFGG